ncbi:unnamed protein product [Protopolystoma xenopodis]|uniref:Uncharacterized protein n=1 Tax=Protopolystoma xenopodis TaxID=117903 RepID=A0A448WKA1_9PLAT|nr:unnamed protein product [Protopolystoma xenopodis]
MAGQMGRRVRTSGRNEIRNEANRASSDTSVGCKTCHGLQPGLNLPAWKPAIEVIYSEIHSFSPFIYIHFCPICPNTRRQYGQDVASIRL